MSDVRTNSNRREDSFLPSRGIDQSTVAMVGAILVVAFLLLSLTGKETADETPSATDAAALTQPAEPVTDIAGSGVAVTNAGEHASD